MAICTIRKKIVGSELLELSQIYWMIWIGPLYKAEEKLLVSHFFIRLSIELSRKLFYCYLFVSFLLWILTLCKYVYLLVYFDV